MKKILIGMFASPFVIGCIISIGGAKTDDVRIVHSSPTDPLNATYMVEDQKIRLIDGRSETEAAPSSATKAITSVFGKPAYGNIDGRGDVDAALILTYDRVHRMMAASITDPAKVDIFGLLGKVVGKAL